MSTAEPGAFYESLDQGELGRREKCKWNWMACSFRAQLCSAANERPKIP
jgi:hypothetical protein